MAADQLPDRSDGRGPDGRDPDARRPLTDAMTWGERQHMWMKVYKGERDRFSGEVDRLRAGNEELRKRYAAVRRAYGLEAQERGRLAAENEALKERADESERALRQFQAGLTDALRVHNVPAMPSWPEAIHWLARKDRAEVERLRQVIMLARGRLEAIPMSPRLLIVLDGLDTSLDAAAASDEQEATG